MWNPVFSFRNEKKTNFCVQKTKYDSLKIQIKNWFFQITFIFNPFFFSILITTFLCELSIHTKTLRYRKKGRKWQIKSLLFLLLSLIFFYFQIARSNYCRINLNCNSIVFILIINSSTIIITIIRNQSSNWNVRIFYNFLLMQCG